MQRFVLAACAVVFGSGYAIADKAAKKILNAAIKAQGGKKHLNQIKAMKWKAKGWMKMGEQKMDYKINYAMDGAGNKFRFDMDLPGGMGQLLVIYNNGKAWEKLGENQREMDKKKLEGFEQQVHSMRCGMLNGLTGKGVKLTAVAEMTDGDMALEGFKVSDGKHKDVTLYFDKKNHYLRLTKTMSMDEMTGKWVSQEVRFSGYYKKGKDVFFKKISIKQDGKAFIEEEMIDPKPLEKIDPKLFEKP